MSSRPANPPIQALPRTNKPGRVRNVLSNWGTYFLALAINLFLSPFVVHHLGNQLYGVWTLIVSLTGYLGLLDLGVRGAVTRYVAKFHANSEHGEAGAVASSAMVIFGSAALIAIFISLILAAFVISHLDVPLQYLAAARVVLLLTGLNIAVSLINGVFGGIVVGLQRFDLMNGVEVSINILRAVSVLGVLWLGFGILALACVQLAFTVARWVANVALVRHLYPRLQLRPYAADRAHLKLIFSFSVFSFLLHVSDSLIYASDNIVIGAYLPVVAIAFYAIGGNLVEYARQLVSGISQTMTPLASSIEARKDPNQLRRLVLQSSRWSSMAILPVICTFLVRGRSFISLWMGRQYASPSGQVLWVLSLTMIFWAANSTTAGILLGISKHKPIVPAFLAEGICNLALSAFLVKRIGIIGVAWGTVVPSFGTNLVFWPWYVRRALGIQPLAYAVSAWVRPCVSISPFVLGTYAIERLWPATNLIVFFSQVALVMPLAVVGYWLGCLTRDQREEYSRKFSTFRSRAFARG